MGSVLWFRFGLRFHDNPALHGAVKNGNNPFFPIFIFDGESAGTKLVGYNRMRFLTEALADLDSQLHKHGGRLFVFEGSPTAIFKRLNECLGIDLICFELDCEPIWQNRDNSVKSLCLNLNIKFEEHVSHTLWNPFQIIEENGGTPPLTYQSFLYIASTVGDPPRPLPDVDWKNVTFGTIPRDLANELKLFDNVPTPEELGFKPEIENAIPMIRWKGGETQALKCLTERLRVEESAFHKGYFQPSQAKPDLLGPPNSLSPALRFGCLSVRRFYWSLHDLFKSVHGDKLPVVPHITGQLVWREYFYTMSVHNPYYAEMKKNPICLNIRWYNSNNEKFHKWCSGKTGYPFIDAIMRQLLIEGWIHHIARNAVACFLTRGDLWISWEYGLQHFLKYLLDADWSVCAGNWMWVSSSAFEQLLDCSHCICPVAFGKRFDPNGDYIKRYVHELNSMPLKYIHEPWKAPIHVQEKANCIIGNNYPERIVDHIKASKRNFEKMQAIREATMKNSAHCRPSNEIEVKTFFGLPEECHQSCLN